MVTKYFAITSVAKEDLESIGYNTKKVSDTMMTRIASKMADTYVENSFWIDLEFFADAYKIPKYKK
jgi:hypothetical protein